MLSVAIWIFQKAEREGVRPLSAFTNPNATALFSALRDAKTRVIEGDYDVLVTAPS